MRLLLAAGCAFGAFFLVILAVNALFSDFPIILAPFLAVVFIVLLVVSLVVFNSDWRDWTTIFKRRPPPLTVEDVIFGELVTDSGVSKDGTRLWEGEVTFSPTDETIYIHIESGDEGPTEIQRQFYQEIEQRYNGLIDDLNAALVAHRPSEGEYGYPADYHFTLEGLSIGPAGQEPAVWNLIYGWIPESEWVFSVSMKGWSVDYVGVVH